MSRKTINKIAIGLVFLAVLTNCAGSVPVKNSIRYNYDTVLPDDVNAQLEDTNKYSQAERINYSANRT